MGLYCTIFFFLGVNVVFNIFTSFTIDIFVTLKDKGGVVQSSDDAEAKNLVKMEKKIAVAQDRGNQFNAKELHHRMSSQVMRRRIQAATVTELQDSIEEADKLGKMVGMTFIKKQR